MDRVRELLKAAPARHADETPARAAGGMLPGCTGIIVRDGYSGYGHLTGALHAWCGAHLLRDLKGLYDFEPGWASQMAALLIQARDAATAARRIARRLLGFEDMILRFAPALTWTSSPTTKPSAAQEAPGGLSTDSPTSRSSSPTCPPPPMGHQQTQRPPRPLQRPRLAPPGLEPSG